MKKLIVALVAMLALLVLATHAAYNAGISHAIHGAEITVLEFYDQNDPFDALIILELDGEVWEYDGYIG